MNKTIVLVLAALACLGLVIACGGGEDPKPKATQYTVKFNVNGTGVTGITPATVADQKAKKNAEITLPALTSTSHTFNGWAEGASGGTAQKGKYKVTKNVTLYGRWTPGSGGTSWTVSFDYNGGTKGNPGPDSISVADGQTGGAAWPAVPTKSGNGFSGWFKTTDTGFATQYSSTTSITENLALKAKWDAVVLSATIKYNLNHTDTAGASAAIGDKTVTDGKVGALPTTAPTRSEGWGVGMEFDDWWTAATGGTKVTADTPTTSAEFTIYAHWKFVAGTPTVDGQTLVHNAPMNENNSEEDALQGAWYEGNEIFDDGSVLFNIDADTPIPPGGAAGYWNYKGGAVRYRWKDIPNIKDYDFAEVSVISTGSFGVLYKKGMGAADYATTPVTGAGNASGNIAPTGTTLRFALTNSAYVLEGKPVDGYDSGICFQRSTTETPTRIKITKVVFTKGTRHAVTFDANYPAAYTGAKEANPAAMQAAEGVNIGTLPVMANVEGYKFTGWATEDNTVYTSTTNMPAGALALKGQWMVFKAAAPITVDFTEVTFSSIGDAVESDVTADSYTYTLANYNQYVAFTVTLPNGIALSDYDKISFDLDGGGEGQHGHQYKNANVQDGTAYTNPGSNGANNVTTYNGVAQNVLALPDSLEFDIAKSKASVQAMTGEIKLGVVVNAAGDIWYTVSNFKIYQVED
jgi:hypothetical protein